MNKKELIETYTNRLKYTSTNPQVQESRRALLQNIIYDLEHLKEPTAPEVVVPQWFADWIEDCPVKDKGQVVYDVWFNYENDYFTKEQDNWLQDNKELATRAILDGYVVEKEPLYYVKLIDDKYLNLNRNTGSRFLSTEEINSNYQTKFTEAEIKAIDERYWPFAVKVEDD